MSQINKKPPLVLDPVALQDIANTLELQRSGNYVKRFTQNSLLTDWKIPHDIQPIPGYPPESWKLSLYLEPNLSRDVSSNATYLYADKDFLYMRWSTPVKGEIGVLILSGLLTQSP